MTEGLDTDIIVIMFFFSGAGAILMRAMPFIAQFQVGRPNDYTLWNSLVLLLLFCALPFVAFVLAFPAGLLLSELLVAVGMNFVSPEPVATLFAAVAIAWTFGAVAQHAALRSKDVRFNQLKPLSIRYVLLAWIGLFGMIFVLIWVL